MPAEKTIEEKWQSYMAAVVPPDAGPYQIQATMLAFYAGAIAFMSLLLHLKPGDVANVGRLYDELMNIRTEAAAKAAEAAAAMRKSGQVN